MEKLRKAPLAARPPLAEGIAGGRGRQRPAASQGRAGAPVYRHPRAGGEPEVREMRLWGLAFSGDDGPVQRPNADASEGENMAQCWIWCNAILAFTQKATGPKWNS